MLPILKYSGIIGFKLPSLQTMSRLGSVFDRSNRNKRPKYNVRNKQ